MYYIAVDIIFTNGAVLGLCLRTSLSLILYNCSVIVTVWSQQCTRVLQSMSEFLECMCIYVHCSKSWRHGIKISECVSRVTLCAYRVWTCAWLNYFSLKTRMLYWTHYSIVVFLWPPYVVGQAIIFLPCDFYLLLSSTFFPRLISAVGDWMSTMLPHMVSP